MSDSESRSETSEREEQTIDLADNSLIDFADPNDGVFDIQMEEDMLREQEAEEKEDDPQESKESNLKKRKSGGKKGRALGASKWFKTEIALLLETIDDKWYILKTAAKKKPVWVLIADTMELNGFSRNFTACANKWKVLRNEHQNLYPRPMSASMNSQMYPPSHPPSEFAHAQGQKKCRVDSCTNSAQFGYDGEVIACAIHKFQDMS